ncbi:MAG: 3'-5' exonuclease [Gammaproteobacteria bacterium RIFCSPLOWO2_02_FULL_42_9]|nr:MAG: 3'-5' exonuclease [Gammaproteobacteria bacterium RIFCSPLOWO2_02_FULL_42_9]
MNIFVFDIETVPDVEAGRRIYGIDSADDAKVAEIMFAQRREKTGGSDFLPHYLHRIAAISAVLKTSDLFKVWSLGELDSSEADIIKRFFTGIDRYTPTLVSWNGGGFDLPVLHYRSLLHGIAAPRYWETGDDDREFKWNNYISRYHARHTDLMDVLAGYQTRANAPLDAIATMLGLPGKMGMDGSKVWESYLKGDLAGIRNYCETDVLNTYLLYQRFRLVQGKLTESAYQKIGDEVREFLKNSQEKHLLRFLERWSQQTVAV